MRPLASLTALAALTALVTLTACGADPAADSTTGGSGAAKGGTVTVRIPDPGNAGVLARGKQDGSLDEALAAVGAKVAGSAPQAVRVARAVRAARAVREASGRMAVVLAGRRRERSAGAGKELSEGAVTARGERRAVDRGTGLRDGRVAR